MLKQPVFSQFDSTQTKKYTVEYTVQGPKLRFPGRHYATKNFALATRISQLVASGRLTISCHDNYTNNNFDFQPN